jgi:hypothetical protein
VTIVRRRRRLQQELQPASARLTPSATLWRSLTLRGEP